MTTKATATVRMTIEIPARSAWGDNCTLEQVFRQAKVAVIEDIRFALRGKNISIIGEPEVSTIITDFEK